jgi:pimeloyl-ACP methyl ester carboxylesterase
VAFDRRGHGFTADTDAAFHYDDMATETIGVLEEVVRGPAHIVGWSDGGIVGLLVALARPDLVNRLVLIGVNFHHDGILPLDLDPSSPLAAMMLQSYAERSPDGAEHFGDVFAKFLTMATTEPTLTVDDLRRVTAPTLVTVGDDDLIRFDHTCALYESLPAGQLCVVPRASHALPIEYPDETARIVLSFLAADLPPQTFMPLRRAGGPPHS